MLVFASAMLAACSSTPPIGSNEPPDSTDRVRSLNLEPRVPEATGTINTGTGGMRPQVYYGSSGAQVMVDVDANSPSSGSEGGGEGITLNFEDTPVSAVAKIILGDISRGGLCDRSARAGNDKPLIGAAGSEIATVVRPGKRLAHDQRGIGA